VEEEVDFFDTNIAVASAIVDHPHHETCYKRLAKLRKKGGACAAHSLAEVYSTLTRGGRGYNVPPLVAIEIIEELRNDFTLVALTATETLPTIQHLARSGIAGPLVYEGLLLACARKIKARTIYTNDIYDFRRLAPDLAFRIVLP